jgi:DNA-binding MarR family transcriptional regulator
VLKQFRIIFKSIRRHFDHIREYSGLSGAQLWALSCIKDNPCLRVSDLARAMTVHQSTASNLVEKLVSIGAISRQKSSEDQRVTTLVVSGLGERMLSDAPGPVQGILPNALARMEPDTLRALHANLEALLAVMDDLEAEAANIPLSDI